MVHEKVCHPNTECRMLHISFLPGAGHSIDKRKSRNRKFQPFLWIRAFVADVVNPSARNTYEIEYSIHFWKREKINFSFFIYVLCKCAIEHAVPCGCSNFTNDRSILWKFFGRNLSSFLVSRYGVDTCFLEITYKTPRDINVIVCFIHSYNSILNSCVFVIGSHNAVDRTYTINKYLLYLCSLRFYNRHICKELNTFLRSIAFGRSMT